jgi:hypothetical protein
MQRYRLALKEDVKEILANLPLFASWPADRFDQLAAHAVLEYFGPDYAIVREGDPCDSFYVIKQGMVRLGKAIPKPAMPKLNYAELINPDIARDVEKPGRGIFMYMYIVNSNKTNIASLILTYTLIHVQVFG